MRHTHKLLLSLPRALVGRADGSAPGREAGLARVELAPAGKAGRHTHPGDEISDVLEGGATLRVDGQPRRVVKAGESFVIPAGSAHDAHNTTAGTVKLALAAALSTTRRVVAAPANRDVKDMANLATMGD